MYLGKKVKRLNHGGRSLMRMSLLYWSQKEQHSTLKTVICQDLPRQYLFTGQNHILTNI
jgi:hypothetical protein